MASSNADRILDRPAGISSCTAFTVTFKLNSRDSEPLFPVSLCDVNEPVNDVTDRSVAFEFDLNESVNVSVVLLAPVTLALNSSVVS